MIDLFVADPNVNKADNAATVSGCLLPSFLFTYHEDFSSRHYQFQGTCEHMCTHGSI